MLSRFHVKGFRCLRDVELALSPLTVLIGPNDSGKSSFLDGLFALSRIAQDGLEKQSQGGGDVWTVGRLDLKAAISGAGRCEMRLGHTGPDGEQLEYRLDMSVEKDRRVEIDQELIWEAGKRVVWVENDKLEYSPDPKGPKSIMGPDFRRGRLNSIVSCKEIADPWRERWFGFQPMAMHSFQPQALAAPWPIPLKGPPPLEVDGGGLAALLDYYLGSERDLFDALEEKLRQFSPMVEKLQVKPAETSRPIGTGKQIFFRIKGGSDVPASQASDGLLFALGFLALVYSPRPPVALLVEEPENGIHPDNLEVIMGLFRRLSEGGFGSRPVQVILTTHSPYLLDLAEPEEVRVVTRHPEEGTRVVQMSAIPDMEEKLRDFKLGELWTAIGDEAIGQGSGQ
ncbi:MAG: AAA family ATPase [Deltaproteobacteria bacterium]|nr:AAA family ATPase [Deltaproteobacteria bacterium]